VFDQRGELPLLPFGNPIGFVPASRGGVYIKLTIISFSSRIGPVPSLSGQGLVEDKLSIPLVNDDPVSLTGLFHGDIAVCDVAQDHGGVSLRRVTEPSASRGLQAKDVSRLKRKVRTARR